MTEEYSEAISIANNYFTLVDGLALGLENHLAEDVVLDWFGRTVKGRRNVTAFIRAHKVNSRHKFPEIVPVAEIGYKRNHRNRKQLLEKTADKAEVNSDCNETKKGALVDDDMTYDLNEGDLCNLFKLEITSTNVEEIEQSINRMKLEEEMAPTVNVVKRECGQGDGLGFVRPSTIKYLEANGEIEFSRRCCWKRDVFNQYVVSSNVHTWKRVCRLQIAYSNATDRVVPPAKLQEIDPMYYRRKTLKEPRNRLPSLDEISELSSKLVPNPNSFGGYLRTNDFFDDRDEFLERLEIDMSAEQTENLLCTPRYIGEKLVFDKTFKNENMIQAGRDDFVFNYQIHLIIYEGSEKCRVNLLHQFVN